jgi:hypothetical protein
MSYRIAGIDVHKKMLAVVVSDVEVTNRELVSFENHVSIYANSASLRHSRSPFLCALERVDPLGAHRIPQETGLLIPSD